MAAAAAAAAAAAVPGKVYMARLVHGDMQQQ